MISKVKYTINLCKKSCKITIIRSLSSSNNILNDIKVLDLTRIIAGPLCTMILGDMGADVIKVEKPGTGDECRSWGPPFMKNTSTSCYFTSVNRNKRSICIDLKSHRGRDLIYELVNKCDVLVENFVPGTLDKLKLSYKDLTIVAPHLIYCSITGYGSEGPYRKRPGYDVIAASVGGLLNITGPINGEPVKVGVAVTDIATGLYAHGAILAALIQRNKTGKGQKIDCNLLSTQIASLINIGSNYLNAGKKPKRWGSAHESLVPYQMFKTKNGYLTLGVGSDAQFRDFCEKLGVPDLINDEKYRTNALRVENREKLIEIIENVMKLKSNKEWMSIFENSSFPCGPVNELNEVFNDPHVKNINLVKSVHHPVMGEIKMVGPPVKYSNADNDIRLAPPLLGEHTDEILIEFLGYNRNQIVEMRNEGIIR